MTTPSIDDNLDESADLFDSIAAELPVPDMLLIAVTEPEQDEEIPERWDGQS